LRNWWVVYKVNPKIHTRRNDEYIERHEDDDIYQEEIEVHQNFTISDGAGLTELATGDAEPAEQGVSALLRHERTCPQDLADGTILIISIINFCITNLFNSML
jgi:hypothetical protein